MDSGSQRPEGSMLGSHLPLAKEIPCAQHLTVVLMPKVVLAKCAFCSRVSTQTSNSCYIYYVPVNWNFLLLTMETNIFMTGHPQALHLIAACVSAVVWGGW